MPPTAAPAASSGDVAAADGGPRPSGDPATETIPPHAEPAESQDEEAIATRKRKAPPQPTSVGRYEVIELSFPYQSAGLGNPWQDVSVTAAFRTPSGHLLLAEGFYYDVDTYRVRFVPTELGEFEYSVDLRGPWGNDTQAGKFTVLPSSRKGFIRKLASNPYRLVFEDGSIVNGVGINDCWEKTGELNNFVDAGQKVDLDTYMRLYGKDGAGFDVFRFGPGNCSFELFDTLSNSGNTYLVRESKWADRLLETAHKNGFHVMFTFFAHAPQPEGEAAYRLAVRYLMARYGAYVDIWELTNQTEKETPPLAFLQTMAAYVKQLDPYKRIVTNSHPRLGDWNMLDARSPHLTIEHDAFADMKALTNGFTTKAPVIAGAIYNPGNRNWDEHAAQRLRMYTWTSFMSGMLGVYWNTSATRDCDCTPGNMYLGSDERRAVFVFQKLAEKVSPSAEAITLALSGPPATGYALRSNSALLAYLYRPAAAHKAATTFSVDVPVDGLAWFLDPATGEALQQTPVRRGQHTLTTPLFAQDLIVQIE